MVTIEYENINNFLKEVIDFSLEVKKKSVAKRRQVSSVILDIVTHEILSYGYNHNIINGDKDACCENEENKTFPTVIHAEENAIFNFLHEYNMEDITPNVVLLTTFFPCWWCAKLILQSKIKTIYYLDYKEEELDTEMVEVRDYLEGNGVQITYIKNTK